MSADNWAAREEAHYLGTAREVADRNIERFRAALARAISGGSGNVEVIRDNLDAWLEYRHDHQQAGTLDEDRYL